MNNDNNSASGDLPRKPMAGKYDGGKNNGATKVRRRLFSNLGRRTNWAKHLEKTSVSKTLRKFDAIADPEDLYRRAWEEGKLELCAALYKQFQDRLMGRPYIATNPDEKDRQGAAVNDPRLQIAIQNLVLAPQQEARERKAAKIKQLEGLTRTQTLPENVNVGHDARQVDAPIPEESDDIPESTKQLI